MSHRTRRRRHRVAVRPKVRSQRMRQLGAVGALACLGGLALLTVLQLQREGVDWSAIREKLVPAPRAVAVDGAPPLLQEQILALVGPRAANAVAPAEVLAAFPCLKSATLSRSFVRGRLSYGVQVRQPLGVVVARGGQKRYFDKDVRLFEAPEGLYDIAAPVLELDGAAKGDLEALAAFLPEALRPGALSSPLARMRFVSASDGWLAELSDRTSLQWGDLRFTRQKFERLREILADARAQFGGAASADMRYFEDGRVLLRPLGRGVK